MKSAVYSATLQLVTIGSLSRESRPMANHGSQSISIGGREIEYLVFRLQYDQQRPNVLTTVFESSPAILAMDET